MAAAYVWLCAVFVSIGGFLFGYETGSINGVKEMPGFRETFNISFNQDAMGGVNATDGASVQCGSEDDVETSALLGTIVSIFSIGALVGTLVSGLLSDLAGRRVTVAVGATTCVLGGVLQSSSFYLWMLFPGRIVNGIGTGILLQACSLYIAEIAPKGRRGAMVSMVVTFTLIASVTSVVVNVITERFAFGWRITLSIPILVSLVLVCGTIWLPETPRFLLKKHKDAKAFKVLKKIYKVEDKAQDELESIKLTLRHSTSKEKWTEKIKYFCNFSIIQRVFIGFMLMLLARTAGPPVIIYYSVAIFCKLGVDGFIGSIVLFVLMLLAQISGIFLVDKCGRKTLLLIGAIVLGFSQTSAAALIQIFDLENEGDLSVGRRVAGYLVIALICLMMCVNNLSYGSVVWVVLSEIYPLRIRGVGAALGQLGWWGGTFIMGEIGPVLISSPLKTSGTFYLLSGMCLVAFLHVLLLLPETKGRSLEDIEALFKEPWLKRADVLFYIRCGCFCCFPRGRRRLVQTEMAGSDDQDEREQLHEPADQISLNSFDTINLVNDEAEISTL